MRKFRSQPTLSTLEQRLTPAFNGDLVDVTLHTVVNSAFISFAEGSHAWMESPNMRLQLHQMTQTIFEQSADAVNTYEGAKAAYAADIAADPAEAVVLGPMIAAISQFESIASANYSFAQNIASWQDFELTLPIPSAPTPITPAPTDAGMTNTMPAANDPSWVVGANGLKTWDVVTGSGTPVSAGSSITVFYTGWLASNGTVFDSRRSPAAPTTFTLTNLIQGWQQGIVGMKPGGIRRLYVPAALGYGAAGSPPNVPANADLIFEIKLTSTT
jgi:hypothetical protein